MSETLIRNYFTAFNIRDIDGALALVDDDVDHAVVPGRRERGKPAFRAYLEAQVRSRDERFDEIVVMADAEGRRFAAEYTAQGTYGETEAGLPAAARQEYVVAGGCFFLVVDGRIVRITRYDNLPDWLWQREEGA